MDRRVHSVLKGLIQFIDYSFLGFLSQEFKLKSAHVVISPGHHITEAQVTSLTNEQKSTPVASPFKDITMAAVKDMCDLDLNQFPHLQQIQHVLQKNHQISGYQFRNHNSWCSNLQFSPIGARQIQTLAQYLTDAYKAKDNTLVEVKVHDSALCVQGAVSFISSLGNVSINSPKSLTGNVAKNSFAKNSFNIYDQQQFSILSKNYCTNATSNCECIQNEMFQGKSSTPKGAKTSRKHRSSRKTKFPNDIGNIAKNNSEFQAMMGNVTINSLHFKNDAEAFRINQESTDRLNKNLFQHCQIDDHILNTLREQLPPICHISVGKNTEHNITMNSQESLNCAGYDCKLPPSFVHRSLQIVNKYETELKKVMNVFNKCRDRLVMADARVHSFMLNMFQSFHKPIFSLESSSIMGNVAINSRQSQRENKSERSMKKTKHLKLKDPKLSVYFVEEEFFSTLITAVRYSQIKLTNTPSRLVFEIYEKRNNGDENKQTHTSKNGMFTEKKDNSVRNSYGVENIDQRKAKSAQKLNPSSKGMFVRLLYNGQDITKLLPLCSRKKYPEFNGLCPLKYFTDFHKINYSTKFSKIKKKCLT